MFLFLLFNSVGFVQRLELEGGVSGLEVIVGGGEVVDGGGDGGEVVLCYGFILLLVCLGFYIEDLQNLLIR